MKLTQRQIKRIIKEELEKVIEEQEAVLEESILGKIKSFFTGDPFKGDPVAFDKDAKYSPGTYGAFAQSNSIVKKLKDKNVELSKNTISTAGQALIGTGDAKVGTIIGMGMAIAGLVPTLPVLAATAFGYAGLTAGAIGLVKLFRKEPKKAKQFPLLKAFQMDEDLIEIIDDRVEAEIIKSYEEIFLQKLKSNPTDQIENINIFSRKWLAQNKNNRTVVAPSDVFSPATP